MKINSKIYLKTKDFLVSGEEFSLLYDEDFDMLVTHPQPENEQLSAYYKSEFYISHTDSRTSFTDRIYQLVKNFALRGKIRLIEKQNKGTRFPLTRKLLDIGCGTGDFLVKAKQKEWQVFGVEPNEQARELSKLKGIFVEEKLQNIQEGNFDVITLWHVLEHLPDLEAQIEIISQKLKPNGTLVVAVPNFKSFDAKHYKTYWAAYDVPRHLWHFSKEAVKRIFSKHRFELVKTKPMWFDAFYVSLLSEKYKTGKSNFFKAFWVGLRSNFSGMVSKEYSSHIYILKKRN